MDSGRTIFCLMIINCCAMPSSNKKGLKIVSVRVEDKVVKLYTSDRVCVIVSTIYNNYTYVHIHACLSIGRFLTFCRNYYRF